ncbi:acyl-CoA thioesterase II [Polaribacter reichenbachii]|uniref:Acyl-CoA thioesterase 2 n=1 Tax=Polaribacter reichenbachii TaxID=996801 RepID=A0A1B8TUZ5_9FLAO|nr:acyl-CoA thioesterase II [Polaribacter reichenbachii]APZ45366.1 acyl-CoA thioesterase II [Polaribacter reichenbachii]AUC19227.1 acyl-CoA thioesterase II [Polaribacter reichenbachii]OBY63616.1 acyl-CoA thioesterase II [Polaribacter reichenbachii]
MNNSKELISLLSLKELEENKFLGESVTIGSAIVFGGQVLAQAVHSAYRTIPENRFLHSLHSYFLEPGDLTIPITYDVAEVRNGGSFSTRRVTASQNNKTIFILAASFHKKEEGFEHQVAMKTDIKQPEELLSWDDMIVQLGDFLPKSMKSFLSIERPIAFKPVVVPNPLAPKNRAPKEEVWFKLKGDIPEMDIQMKHQILTYISDYNVLNAAFNPNAKDYNFGNTMTASLDHSMWFFRDFDFNDWMLFSAESPNTYGARGLCKANIFTRDGKLVASLTQEGLLRPKK